MNVFDDLIYSTTRLLVHPLRHFYAVLYRARVLEIRERHSKMQAAVHQTRRDEPWF